MKLDYFFLTLIIVILAYGLLMLASASSDIAKIKFNDSYFYLKHQFLHGILPGLLFFLFFLKFPYFKLKKISPLIFVLVFFLLVLALSPLGATFGGAQRWIKLGNFTFQPGELMKFGYVLYLCAWLTRGERIKNLKESFPFFFSLTFAVVLLLFFQKSTSIAFILSLVGLIIYFCSGVKIHHVITGVLILAIIFGLAIYFAPYRVQRILSFFSRNDLYGQNYHLRQSISAIKRGGIFGLGYGRSITKIKYLPEAISDSIFSVIAEEFGFLGGGFTIFIYSLILWRGIVKSLKNRDRFGKLLMIGIVSLISIQAIVHISSNSGLLPYTGVPLPFISYGGTAMVVFLAMAGLFLNISKHK